MRYAVLGTGMVGNTLASKLAGLGHEVRMGARTECAGVYRLQSLRYSIPPGETVQQHITMRSGSIPDPGCSLAGAR